MIFKCLEKIYCMEKGKVEKYILELLEKGEKLLFTVIDPLDHPSLEKAADVAALAYEKGAHAICVGGSTGVQNEILDNAVKLIKERVSIPIILFPGNIGTITPYADAIYFMSLLNSRNSYWITKAQMLAAPVIKRLGIEPLPVGYIVVEPGGTVGWVGEADLIPRNKPYLAASLALAAQYMGFRFVFTDAGSNPPQGHVPLEIISAVRKAITIPYIVGGGIRKPEEARNVAKAGADILMIGTAFEKDRGKSLELFLKAIKEV